MKKIGFTLFESDLCLFRNITNRAILILYVNDLLLIAPTVKVIYTIANKLYN